MVSMQRVTDLLRKVYSVVFVCSSATSHSEDCAVLSQKVTTRLRDSAFWILLTAKVSSHNLVATH